MSKSDLEKFVQKNQKTTKKDEPASSGGSRHQAKDPLAFFTVFQLLNGTKLGIFFAMGLVIFGVGFYRLLIGYGLAVNEIILWLVVGAFVLCDFFFFYFLFHFAKYQSVLNKKKWALEGWRELVHNRSDAFWKGNTYLRVGVKIELSAKASSVHHQAVQIFLEQCVKRWGSKHSGTWKGPKPSEMEIKGTSLNGEVAIHTGTTFLVRLLAFHLPPFAAMLGDGLSKISFAAQGEREYNYEAEADPYQEERDRKWMDKEF